MFERIDRDKRRKLLSMRNSGLRGQGGGLKPEPEKAISGVAQMEKKQSGLNNKDIGDGSAAEGVANQHAFPSRQGMNVQTPRVDQASLKGTGVGSFDELWDLGSARNEGPGRSLTMKVKGFANRLVRQAKRRVDVSRANGWTPIALNSVYFRDGTLSLLGYGDEEARYETFVAMSIRLSWTCLTYYQMLYKIEYRFLYLFVPLLRAGHQGDGIRKPSILESVCCICQSHTCHMACRLIQWNDHIAIYTSFLIVCD
jgi:hypothetical protein